MQLQQKNYECTQLKKDFEEYKTNSVEKKEK